MASFLAISSDGSRTSQVAKVFSIKVLTWDACGFDNRFLGSTASTSSVIGNISFSLKYFVYFVTCRSHGL